MVDTQSARPLFLLTRPHERSLELKATLNARGVDTIISPVLSVETADPPPPGVDPSALLMTSAAAANACADWQVDPSILALPVFAVGPATEKAAGDAGFTQVITGPRDSAALVDTVEQWFRKERAGELSQVELLHLHGSVVRSDPLPALETLGFRISRHLAYRTTEIDHLTPDAEAALEAQKIDVVLLFSPRSAAIFQRTIERTFGSLRLASTRIVAISEVAALPFQGAAEHERWQGINVAETPRLGAMLAAAGLDGNVDDGDKAAVEADEVTDLGEGGGYAMASDTKDNDIEDIEDDGTHEPEHLAETNQINDESTANEEDEEETLDEQPSEPEPEELDIIEAAHLRSVDQNDEIADDLEITSQSDVADELSEATMGDDDLAPRDAGDGFAEPDAVEDGDESSDADIELAAAGAVGAVAAAQAVTKDPDADEIIDLEVAEGDHKTDAADAKPETEVKPEETEQPKSKSWGARLAWALVFLLIAFIAGLFYAPVIVERARPYAPELFADFDKITPAENAVSDTEIENLRTRQSALASAINALQQAPRPSANTDQMAARIDELAARVEAIRAAPSANGGSGENGNAIDVAALETRLADRISALEATLANATAPSDDQGAVTGLKATVERLEARIAELETRPLTPAVSADASEDVSQFAEALSALETRLNGLSKARDDVATRIDALASQSTALGQRLDDLPIADSISTESMADTIDTAIASALVSTEDRLTALAAQQETLAAEINTLRLSLESGSGEEVASSNAVAALEDQIAALKSTIAAQETRLSNRLAAVSQSGAPTPQLAAALGVGALNRALTMGQRFDDELDVIMTAVGNENDPALSPALATLQQYAATPPPSRDVLAERLERLAPTLVTAAKTPENAGWFQKLWVRIMTIFQVRRTGEVEGESAEARVSRAEAKAKVGDLEAALDGLRSLGGSAPGAVSEWAEAAERRLAVDKAAAALVAALAQK
ncbi:MAG: uroporphyrinogen-III synthase [Pseudomonadota bacterium]